MTLSGLRVFAVEVIINRRRSDIVSAISLGDQHFEQYKQRGFSGAAHGTDQRQPGGTAAPDAAAPAFRELLRSAATVAAMIAGTSFHVSSCSLSNLRSLSRGLCFFLIGRAQHGVQLLNPLADFRRRQRHRPPPT
jgi:hypothetical protein